jgi:lysophospholipase L1-like esterase
LAPCSGRPLAELLQPDGTHLTERGHELVAKAVLEQVA